MNEAANPWLSVVVPAYNEQKLLAQSLDSTRRALLANGLEPGQWEFIVCDNASTDATARIAARAGARVVPESHRQIARARNTGAAAARGRWLLFVDADTRPDAALLAATLAAMADRRICGGGATVASGGAGPGVTLAIETWNLISRSLGLAAGGYVFCRRRAFLDVHGFNEEFYAGEELDFSRRLKQWGRLHGQQFVILAGVRFTTSLRKVELYDSAELRSLLLRGLLRPRRMLRDKSMLGMWYDGRR